MSLSTYAFAPARRARAMSSSVSYVVRMMTLACGSRSRICRTASTPSITGMRRSRSMTSGRRRSKARTASRPSAASPTTSRSGSWLMMLATPVRSRAWSSTTTTRARSGDMFVLRDRERRRLPRQYDLGAGPRGGDDGQRGAAALGTLLHAGEAEADALALLGDPASVVGDGEPEPDRADGRGVQADQLRTGVQHGVCECFLGDAGDLVHDAGAELRQPVDRELDRHVGRPLGELGHPLQRRPKVLTFLGFGA